MAGAVVVIEPDLPQCAPGETIELGAGGAFREAGGRERDMPLQDPSEILAHLGRRFADRNRPGDVGRAVKVLRAGIEQVERAGFEDFLGFRARSVMHDRAVRPGAGDRRKGQVPEILALLAKRFETVAGGDLPQVSQRRYARQPGKEARHRGAVAAMRRPRTVKLDAVLAGFRQHARIGGAVNLRTGSGKPVEHPGRSARRVDLHRALFGERVERGAEAIRRLDRHLVAKMPVEAGHQLAAVDKQRDRAIGLHHRKGQRQRRVWHVAAADVQQPGDRFRHRQHGGAGAVLGERPADARAFVGGALAGEIVGLGKDRCQRRRWPARPHRVERIFLHRAQDGAGALDASAQPLDFLRRVKPRVVTDRGTVRGRGCEPIRRRLVDQVTDFVGLHVDLSSGLQRVAPVDKHRCPVLKDHRHAGRAGKAGQPRQALTAHRHVFALMLVGARHDEPGQAVGRQPAAQQLQPLATRQPGKILGLNAVMMRRGERRLAGLKRGGQFGRRRLGDERMPARADFRRRREGTQDQRVDRVRVEGRPRLSQRLCQHATLRRHPVHCPLLSSPVAV